MSQSRTVKRKIDHINLCLTDQVEFKSKTNGFDNYEFVHNAITEVVIDKIDLSTIFYGSKIDYPLIISSMTGGARKAEKLNEKLAEVATFLNIPIGVGSQRQALEDNSYYSSYRVVKKAGGMVPILGNIGAAQVAQSKKPVDLIKSLIDMVDASAMIVHLNPLQELLQPEGEPNFKGLLVNLEKICAKIEKPM
ncbi:MAG: alpha-hydroxy-acid oxidizing protein, partial [Melioribacteraceae bacterium]